jgi:hypothetical protein
MWGKLFQKVSPTPFSKDFEEQYPQNLIRPSSIAIKSKQYEAHHSTRTMAMFAYALVRVRGATK